MSGQKLKMLIAAGLAVILITGLVLLNNSRGKVSSTDIRIAKTTESDAGKAAHIAPRRSSGSDSSESGSPGTSAMGKETSNSLYGLPELTLENASINHEKPAEMPLEDWEEYERQRYEMVQLKAYKFRKTDPSKVVPHEIEDVVPEAAKKYEIPQDLLAALLYTSSDGGHHEAEHDIEGGFGLMMLKESPQCDTLGEAAQILGVSREDLIYNQKLNVMGGAAVLSQYYEDAKASGLSDSEAWYMAVSQYSGRPQPELAQALADQVAGNMIKGFEIDSDDGSGYFRQEPNPNPIFYPKNWKVAAVDPPPGVAGQKEQANAVPPSTSENPQAAP